MKTLLIAVRTTLVAAVMCCVLYPAVGTGLGHLLFPDEVDGSLVKDATGRVVGSELIAQDFSSPAYLHPRPSAAGQNGYDPMASGGSNLGPTSQKLKQRVSGALEELRQENPEAHGPVPEELVTASGSGLDPHLSPEGALWQVPRIARARGVSPERVRAAIESQIEPRTFGFLGEPRINVLLVNLALDRQFGPPTGERVGMP